MYGDTVGVWYGSKHVPPHLPLLGLSTDHAKGESITWEGVWCRERVHKNRLRLHHDIQYNGGCGGEGGVIGGLWDTGISACFGLGG